MLTLNISLITAHRNDDLLMVLDKTLRHHHGYPSFFVPKVKLVI